MFLTEHLLKLVCLNNKYLQCLGNYPFKIDYSTKRLFFVNEESLKRENVKLVVLFVIFIVLLYQLLAYRDKFPSVIITEGILYTCIFPLVSILVHIYFKNNCNVTELFNLIVSFEQRLFQGKVYSYSYKII